MNIHSLARTTPHQRLLLVIRIEQHGWSAARCAAALGISPRTVYKWLARWRAEGSAGLLDRSSLPRHSPRQLDPQLVGTICRLRDELRCCALEIAQQLNLAYSTVTRHLRRNPALRTPRPPVQRYEHPVPGALLHLDCKKLGKIAAPGHAVTGDRSRRSRGAGWEVLHVCVDDHSRAAYCEVLPDERAESAAGFLHRAAAWYAGLGVECRAVLSDNGSCFRSRRFRDACAELDLQRRFTRPYRPQTNGKAERFIRTVAERCLYARSYGDSADRSAAVTRWLCEYNYRRPTDPWAISRRHQGCRFLGNNVLSAYS